MPFLTLVLLLAGTTAPPDPLNGVIRRLEEHYNRLETLKAGFVQFYRAEERAPVHEEAGTVYLKKPGRMRWEYTRTETKLFISDGKMVYFYAPEDRQVTRMPAATSGDVRTPLGFLLGRLNLKRSFGHVELAQDFAPLDPGNPVLRLTPKAKEERFRELFLEVDQQSRIRRLVVEEGDSSPQRVPLERRGGQSPPGRRPFLAL